MENKSSFRSRFRRQTAPSSTNNNHPRSKNNKRESIKSRFLSRTTNSSSTTHQQQTLAPFDACIEACDALAASSSNAQRIMTPAKVSNTPVSLAADAGQDQGDDDELSSTSNINNDQSNNNNNANILSDCSVLVSPDGALLFTSQTSSNNTTNNTNPLNNNNNNNTNNKYPWTNIPTSQRDELILNEEYESAIITGNDLQGDYASNGFTASGWDVDAASTALHSSCEVLQLLEQFVECVASERREGMSRLLKACEDWKVGRERLLLSNSSNRHRVGPLLSSGMDVSTNIAIALETMEEYFLSVAEVDLRNWDEAAASTTSSLPTVVASPLADNSNSSISNNGNNTSSFRGMLPTLKDATTKAKTRTSNRSTALNDIRMKVTEAQNILLKQKEWASNQWKRVQLEDEKIDRLLSERREEQQQQFFRSEQQRQRDVRSLLDDGNGRIESEPDISEDVWELVKGVAALEDFGHTGYSPRVNPKISVEDATNEMLMNTTTTTTTPRQINRADIEKESEIQDIRMIAQAADESVEDASSQLLNIMSKQDTTMRSARVASESCLLSECNAVHKCLRSLVAMERSALEERARRLEMLETAVDAIDVRKDIDIYIQNDKLLPGGSSRAGEEDDGGVAAALAVLNSYCVEGGGGGNDSMPHPNIERPNHFEGWGGDNDEGSDETDDVEPELFGEVINLLFHKDPPREPDSPRRGKRDRSLSNSYELKKEEKVALASTALEEKTKRGQSFRQTILYELNNQRSKKTEVDGEANFDSLCRLFNSFLSGCGREAVDVSNAKMAMILSQTFYCVDQEDDNSVDDRESRVYVKNRISHHSIWADEEFWDHALEQCVSESLQKSGVLLNYAKSNVDVRAVPNKSIKWHDLAPSEYADAAAQVHSVVFATIGSLAHSMLEMDVSGSGLSRACNFVRRLSIRYQLPLKMRITLLNHLQTNS